MDSAAASPDRHRCDQGRAVSRRTAVRLAQALILALVAWGIWRVAGAELARIDPAELRRWRPDIAMLALSTVLLLGVYLAHALLWRRIMADMGMSVATARTTLRVYFLASLGKYIPGKVWALAGFAVLAREAGMSPGAAAGAAVVGQIAFLGTGMLFLALMLPEMVSGVVALLAMAALGLGGVALWLLAATPVGRRLREKLRQRLRGRLGERLDSALAIADRVSPATAMLWGAAYGATWILFGAAFVVFAGAFVPEALSQPRQLAGILAASYLLGLLVLLPAGIGAREFAMIALLTNIMPAPAAALVAGASRLWFTLAELLPLAIVPLLPRPAHSETAETR
jgi:glycosyltransferase 2 family protein